MSGIAGIIRLDGAPVDPAHINGMTAAMAYRGTDGTGHWLGEGAALAQFNFFTTPQPCLHAQPLASDADVAVIVMEGRVDNSAELRAKLQGRGVALRGGCDRELVLQAHRLWGRACLEYIDGDFAFAIWNTQRRTLFCARDRFGHRPFHFWQLGQQFAFASDFHALLAMPGSPRRINEGMLAEHLCVYPQSLNETLVLGVERLPPAHWMEVSSQRKESGRYWDVACGTEAPDRHESDYVDQFRELFQDAVRRQTRSMAPTGVYLSGGLDSSSILCSAARDGGSLSPLQSFSLSFPQVPESDEMPYIEAASAQAGIKSHIVPYAPVPFEHFVNRIRRFKDVGEAPNGAMLDPLRMLAAGRGIRVLLTGAGGDDWFGRNGMYLAELLQTGDFRALQQELTRRRRAGASIAQLCRTILYRGISPVIPQPMHVPVRLARRWLRGQSSSANVGAGGFVNPAMAARVGLSDRLRARDPCVPHARAAHRYLHQSLHGGLIVKSNEADSRSLASLGIEERHPFFDRRVVEFAFSLPEKWRSQGMGKCVLRQAMRGVLPESIRNRPDKADFSQVIAHTLMDPQVAEFLPCTRLDAAGFVDRTEINNQYRLFRHHYANGDPRYAQASWQLWAALSLEVWLSVLDCK